MAGMAAGMAAREPGRMENLRDSSAAPPKLPLHGSRQGGVVHDVAKVMIWPEEDASLMPPGSHSGRSM